MQGTTLKRGKFLYPDPARVDIPGYIEDYADIRAHVANFPPAQRHTVALQHWLLHGRDEGRHWRLLEVDYQRVAASLRGFARDEAAPSRRCLLITSLYNEAAPLRRHEYQLALAHNLALPWVERVIVLYDTDRDGPGKNFRDMLPAHPKLELRDISGRPDFGSLFALASAEAGDLAAIANADIALTPALGRLGDIGDRLLALTRWEFVDEQRITVRHAAGQVNTDSNDTWLFQPGLPVPAQAHPVLLGTPNCDGFIAHHFRGRVFNPCWDLPTLHIHFQGGRVGDYVNIERVEAPAPVCALGECYRD